MSAATSRKRIAVDGVLLLDKPAGITSQGAVTRAKAALGALKAGHTGTLDPLATGLLPLTFGEATKFSQALLDADKEYVAAVRLGVTTTTGDLEGDVVTRAAVDVDPARFEHVLGQFRGEIEQTPPMYSALKHAGKPLYQYARAGHEVARTPRRVTISALALESWDPEQPRIRVACSKGTYIRVLAEDIGKALGCGASLAALSRTRVGPFLLEHAVSLDTFARLSDSERLASLLPVDALLAGLPKLDLGEEEAQRILRGQSIVRAGATPGLARVYGSGARFLGVAELTSEGTLTPRRLVSTRTINT